MSAKNAKVNQADIPVAQQHRFKWTDVLVQVGLVLWAIICLFPVYWMFTFSLKPELPNYKSYQREITAVAKYSDYKIHVCMYMCVCM